MSAGSTNAIPSVLIYGDFNCPFSALANARANRLADAGRLRVDWCSVEHDTTIGPNEHPLTSEQTAAFREELCVASDFARQGPGSFRPHLTRLLALTMEAINDDVDTAEAEADADSRAEVRLVG
ncbi:MAG: hypothetical protein KDC08_13930, partial [Actinobacteria bacterium]|nr:hypothetical protein [Actinomycetota bacterium]